jgi:2-amino-4-hydroxy-6-hydroxymethyldihydropteridine diphosphokinase
MVTALLALGSNLSGEQGSPAQMLDFAIGLLQPLGVSVVEVSPFCNSKAVGGHGPGYVNAVLVAEVNCAPAALLRALKRLERRAGRRTNRLWGPRPLDIDILAMGTQHYGFPHRRVGSLTLPHPEMHTRAFVLQPLAWLRPHWHHPGKQRTARQLLAGLPMRVRREVQILHSDVREG